MKNILTFLCCLFLLGLTACNKEKEEIRPYSILPEPQQIEYIKGSFNLKNKPTIAFPSELAGEAALANQYLSEDFSIQPVLKEGKKSGNITLLVDASVLPEHPEGYVLDIQSKKITIKANAPAGILYGIQTLRQLIGTSVETGHAPSLQCGTITDYPAFSWRAFMIDESRHFQGKEIVFKLLDNMSQLKMNVLHWHLVDDPGWRIEIDKYPELTNIGAYRDSSGVDYWKSGRFDGIPHGGFYTKNEIREIVAYAAARHINVMPEIEFPGHATAAIASYPWLGTTGKQLKVSCDYGGYDIFNMADPRVVDFFHDVLTELIELFPYQVIHIGGDETNYDFWKNSPIAVQYMKENGLKTPADLQVKTTNDMSQWLADHNRRMMGWTEITGAKIHAWQNREDNVTEQHLAPGTIVHFWQGDQDLLKKTVSDGYDVVNSFHEYTYLDYSYESIPLEKSYSFSPIPEGLTPEQEKRILGLGCQMWTEWVPNEQKLHYQVYPRIAAYAEVGWTAPEKKDYNRFQESLKYFLNNWEKQGIKVGH
ncbi:hypothetical protein FACS189451_12540 [Bacteroidia bacterium]|nr:hypothetical protein FACS189446_7520 [Bacteroidia bacterium]GHT64805.1 hypothetical protein FACS189451_12540 [Bacteroidia bacterium]